MIKWGIKLVLYNHIEEKIEKLRSELYQITQQDSTNDKEILRVSQLLDTILNEYEQLKK